MTSEIGDLQMRLAFQEDAISSLNDIVSKQNLEIQKLQEQLQILYKRYSEMRVAFDSDQGSGQNLDDSPPPHY